MIRSFMFFVAQSTFLILSFFIILIMIYLFNSLIQSAIFESYRVIQISDSFSEESQEMRAKLKGIFHYFTLKFKSFLSYIEKKRKKNEE